MSTSGELAAFIVIMVMVMMEAVCSSAALLCIYLTRWHNMSQHSELAVTSMRTSSLMSLQIFPEDEAIHAFIMYFHNY